MTKIGRISLLQSQEFTNNYEFARWYRRLVCAPQTVDLFYDPRSTRFVCFSLSGVVVASDFSPCFGGVPFANGIDKDLGEWDTYHHQTYAYNFLGLLHNPLYKIVLLPNVEVTATVKVLSPEQPAWAHTAVFARIETEAAV